MLTFQVQDGVYVQRLDAGDSSVITPALLVDSDVPGLDETKNGPEIGRQADGRFYIVYQKETEADPDDWTLARAIHRCNLLKYTNGCWDTADDWPVEDYADPADESRWLVYPTVDLDEDWIAYLTDIIDDDVHDDGRLRFTTLDDLDLVAEVPVSNSSGEPLFPPRWVDLEGDLFMVTAVYDSGIFKIALVDDAGDVQIITNELAFTVAQPTIGQTADGTYKLIFRSSGSGNTMYIWQCDPDVDDCQDADEWTAQAQFTYSDFDADDVRTYVSSPELFEATDSELGAGLYVAFVAGDAQGFSEIEDGKIWFTRVPESGDPASWDMVEVSDPTEPIRRIEPEIHQATEGPHILWNEENVNDQFATCDDDPADMALVVNRDLDLLPP